MKRIITAALFCTALAGNAKEFELYKGLELRGVAPNGMYLATPDKAPTIIDRQNDKTYNYGSGYICGRGNYVSSNGIVVGSEGTYATARYWKEGKWQDLPVGSRKTVSFSCANGVTPDGRIICGTSDCTALNGSAYPIVSPVIWELNESTGEYEFSMLPVPDRDVTGCIPQQISANFISDDGNTILGNLTDFRGMIDYQIVFHRDGDGVWSYETLGEDIVIKDGAEWPEYPSRPVMPRVYDYLTPEELAAYDKAMEEYNEAMEIADITGIIPTRPAYEDFLETNREKYEADMAQYEVDNTNYLVKLYAFFDAYAENLTGSNFNSNSGKLSANGRFFASNMNFPLANKKTGYSPILYSLDEEMEPFHYMNDSMSVFSVLNDGAMVAGTPMNDESVFSRVPYVISKDGEASTFEEWIKAESPEAYEWLDKNMRYDYTDRNGQQVTGELMLGTVRMSSDATKIIAYVYNPADNGTYDSYFLNLSEDEPPFSGISETAVDNATPAMYFNLQGARVSKPASGSIVICRRGNTYTKIIVP